MRSPLAGTADRSDRCPPSAAYEHARVDWSAYPLCSPSGGGHSADPGQKRVPGKGDNAIKGLTNRGPLQKGGQRRGHGIATWQGRSCAVPTRSCAVVSYDSVGTAYASLSFVSSGVLA